MTGVDRFALETLKAIGELIKENHPSVREQAWSVITPKEPLQALPPNIPHKVISLPHVPEQLWEQIVLPLACARKNLLSLCNSGPIVKSKHYVVIHDAATVRVPESYRKGFRTWYSVMIPGLLKMAAGIGTVSQFSKMDLQSIYSTGRQIDVLIEGAEHLLSLPTDGSLQAKHRMSDKPYVLAVGSQAPHKNFKALIDAVRTLRDPPFDVVIAGGTNPKIFASDQDQLPQWVKYVGYITDAQLKSLYQNAMCFVFPSKYEGYGLPPTEAMALGCPVLCARSASLPEVCGDAAWYFDPNKPPELASKLMELFESPQTRAVLRQKGYDNIVQKTWRNAALNLIARIEERNPQ